MKWLDGLTDLMDSRSWWWTGSLACCSPWGLKESDTAEQLINDNCPVSLEGFKSDFLGCFCWHSGSCVENSAGHWGTGSIRGKEPPCQCRGHRVMYSVPALGSSPGEGHGNPLQYSCLENPMDRGTWWTTAIGSQSQTWLMWLSMCTEGQGASQR